MTDQVGRMRTRLVWRLCSIYDHGAQVSEFRSRLAYGRALSTDLSTGIGDKSDGFEVDMWGDREEMRDARFRPLLGGRYAEVTARYRPLVANVRRVDGSR